MKHTAAAFHWIIHLLEDLHIQYLIDGGLTARAYGATRPLADIDIDVAEKDIPRLLPHVQEYIIFGPSRYKSDLWDLFLLTQNYRSQKIDICGAFNTKL